MPTCVIFHGTGGSPDSNWFPWLASELRSRSLDVNVPRFPTPEGQSLDSWMKAFSDQVGQLSKDMVLIGHSMGVGMILRLLERSAIAVQASFLVSGWEGLLGLADFDALIESFYSEPFDYSQIRRNMGKCYQYHGDNDPYVPLVLAKELAVNLQTNLVVIPGGGHLNAETGYTTFPKLLAEVLWCQA